MTECLRTNGVVSFEGGSETFLHPNSVYGFFVEMNVNELDKLKEEAKQNGTIAKNSDSCKPFFGNVYPLYWGKDKCIYKRPDEHLKNPKGNFVLRLSTYHSLKGKKIYCATIAVDYYEKFENHLQEKYAHLLKTTKEKRDECESL